MKIQFQGLSHVYGNQTVFQGLDAVFEVGKIVALLGPSGCGKSTLLRLLAGLEKIQMGEIQIPSALKQNKAMVFQESQLLSWRTARQNMELPSEIEGKTLPQDVLTQIFSVLGLNGAENKFPHELSGGMKMRVSLGRALVQSPSLLLMDEPFSSLDEATRENLQVLTRQLSLQNPDRLTVFVTHSITEALFLADKIYVMQAGGGWKLQMENSISQERDLDFLNSQEFFEIKKKWTPRLREGFQ